MTSRSLLILALLFAPWSPNAVAHDVPDRVQVSIFLNPEPGRMVVLVRLPANALIDFLLPTLPDSNWLDLKNTDSVVNEAAKVWIADRLVLYEDGVALPKPRVLVVRLSRVNDPSFRNYESALDHLHADPLPTDTLVLQDQVTVDALLEAPIHLPGADFSFAPEFGRLGVLVFTTLLFLPEDGGVRKFSYEGDPPTFHLDATRAKALRNFVSAGFEHVLGDRESLLFLFCVALTFLRIRPVIHFALVMLSGEALSVIACLSFSISATWLPVLSAALVAAIAVYMGIEAIVAVQSKRVGAALIAAEPPESLSRFKRFRSERISAALW